MIKVFIKIGIDQIVEIGEHHSKVEVSMDIVIEEGCKILILIEMTLGETILAECKIIEVRILEVDIEVIVEMTILEEVEIGLGKDNIQISFYRIIEAVAVGLDQFQKPALTEIGLDVLNVGNMRISLRTVQIHKNKKSQNRYNKCMI